MTKYSLEREDNEIKGMGFERRKRSFRRKIERMNENFVL